jgi:hypothetical protein
MRVACYYCCYCCDEVRLCLCGTGPLTGRLSIPQMKRAAYIDRSAGDRKLKAFLFDLYCGFSYIIKLFCHEHIVYSWISDFLEHVTQFLVLCYNNLR